MYMRIQYEYNNFNFRAKTLGKLQMQKQHIASVTERFKEIAGKLPVKEVCRELQITERTYSRMINSCEIVTERKKSKLRAQAITHEIFQWLVDNDFSKKEICEILGINNALFYKKLKELKVEYHYQHHHRERQIPKEVLEKVQTITRNLKEAANNLGMAVSTYQAKVKNAGVKTVFRDVIDKLNSIDPEEFQEAVNKMPVKEVCKKFDITKANYTALIRRYNTKTPLRASIKRIAGITKEDLLKDRAAGKQIKTICAERGIGLSTYRRIINRES